MSQQQQEIAKLESDLNFYKREREVLQNECETKRRALLDQMRNSTTNQRNDIINQIGQLNYEYGRKKREIDSKIYETRLIYFKKLQG
jgi:hypothetical protein